MTLHTDFAAIDPGNEFWVDVYHLMNSIVQPRPIAWISSVSKTGTFNLAPFSYFNICSMNPPVISNSIFFNRDGSEKDTLRNIKATRRYVVGAVSFENAEKANLSSAPFSSSVDEFVEVGVRFIDRGPGEPRLIADSPVQLICELHKTVRLGEGAGVGTLVLGNVRQILISKDLEVENWKQGLTPEMLDNVGRMGANFYSRTTDRFQMERPVVKKS
ncbi:MAG: flavin reductase family protein [Nitrospinaceae bacterium]|nr:flavin reductase family protein [Nitrospinaceae bacterium]NIR54473.1 flavin reductase family protein [Nitrospinaceae bacterium]NIS84892.1 flavin reductase family protein [Nitrospinaceae bacterium]NIT81704.1 flavin reductase family protein [Nitrospinaceae bacterium]NIU43975.1 flavin reductase family protein [Nitrospinaceae bacterium]